MTEEALTIINQIVQLCNKLKDLNVHYRVDFCDSKIHNEEFHIVNAVCMDSFTEEFVRNHRLCESYQSICKQNPNTIIDFESFAEYIKNSLIKFAKTNFFTSDLEKENL